MKLALASATLYSLIINNSKAHPYVQLFDPKSPSPAFAQPTPKMHSPVFSNNPLSKLEATKDKPLPICPYLKQDLFQKDVSLETCPDPKLDHNKDTEQSTDTQEDYVPLAFLSVIVASLFGTKFFYHINESKQTSFSKEIHSLISEISSQIESLDEALNPLLDKIASSHLTPNKFNSLSSELAELVEERTSCMKQEIRSMLLELFKGKDSLTSKLKTRTDDLTKLDQEVFRFWQQDYFRNPITQAFKSRIDQSKQDIKSLQENQTLLIEYAESAVSNPSSFLVNAFKNEIEESKKKIAEQESLIANYSNPNRDPNTLYSTEDISRQLDESLALLERFIHMLYTIDNIKWHIEDSNYSEASPQEQKESTLETIAAIKTTLMQSIQTCSILAHLIYEQEKSPNQVLTIPNSYRETIHQ